MIYLIIHLIIMFSNPYSLCFILNLVDFFHFGLFYFIFISIILLINLYFSINSIFFIFTVHLNFLIKIVEIKYFIITNYFFQ